MFWLVNLSASKLPKQGIQLEGVSELNRPSLIGRGVPD